MLEAAEKQTFLNQRQQLLSQLLQLSAALDHCHSDLAEVQLRRFSGTLIDYLSCGHFKIFLGGEPSGAEYAAIQSTTTRAMIFNDRFHDPAQFDMNTVRAQLDVLAEVLETRFQIEDQMLHRATTAVA